MKNSEKKNAEIVERVEESAVGDKKEDAQDVFDARDPATIDSPQPQSAAEDVAAGEGELSDDENGWEGDAQTEEKPSRRQQRKQRKLSELTHFDNHSFLALLVRSFSSFTLITVAATLVIVLLANWASNNSRINVSVQNVADYDIELRNNTHNPSIPLDVILGVGGWLDIVEAESGDVVYSSSAEERRTYAADELKCIQQYASGVTIRSISFQTADGSFNYFVSKSYSNGTDTPDEYLLLSADLKKLNGTMPEFEDKTEFSRREFDLLVFNPLHDGEEMQKYQFVGRDGVTYFAIYLDVNNDEVSPPWMFVVITIIGIVGLLVTTLGFYIRYINKHVQRPINALDNAMADFAKSGYREKLNYIGSKDFEQLVATFNEMVGLLNASEQQRLALEQDRQRMLAGLSHDLKTPMTVIEGFSKAIRDGVVSEEDKPKYLNLIIAKSEYMSELINGFYVYSKLDHPDFRLNAKQTDVVEFVRSFLAEKYDEFDIRGYELQANLSDSRVIVQLDGENFTRVLDNLVSNFFKYTPQGSVLAIEERQEGDSVKIYVMDNGEGIPQAARKDIFAPFVVADESRSKQGTGLGLAVCKKIVEAHGGEIKLLDPVGEFNTVFEITLPICPPSESKD